MLSMAPGGIVPTEPSLCQKNTILYTPGVVMLNAPVSVFHTLDTFMRLLCDMSTTAPVTAVPLACAQPEELPATGSKVPGIKAARM